MSGTSRNRSGKRGRPPTKHGHAYRKTATYRSWLHMKSRCANVRDPKYAQYGGRGIRVCERWLSFPNFLADMGERPPGTTLDRFPDGAGDYEPGNCRWATPAQQSRNSRNRKLTPDLVQEIHGRCEHGESMSSVARRLHVGLSTVVYIRRGLKWADQMKGPTA